MDFVTVYRNIKSCIERLTSKKGITDVSGVALTPGNCGRDCLGNGEHYDRKKRLIECCCNECDFSLCCLESHDNKECLSCKIRECPRAKKK